MDDDKKECCGTCRFNKIGRVNGDAEYMCACMFSEIFGLETEYDYSCSEYKERKRRSK